MLVDDLAVSLIDVLLFRHKNDKYHTAPRQFAALSFRLRSHGSYFYRGRQISAETNEISFIPPNIGYDRVTDSEEVIVLHFMMYNYTTDDIEVFHPAEPEKYRELFMRVLTVWESREPGYRASATALFYEILSLLRRDSVTEGNGRDRLIVAAEKTIQQQFQNPELTVASLSRSACVSEAYFRRRFKAYYGMSPKQYLDNYRMQYAVSLIQTGYYSQKEIAARCGFSDVKYFRTAFRHRTGVSPSQYHYWPWVSAAETDGEQKK